MFLLAFVSVSFAQQFQFYAGASYDPSIPTLKQTVGHEWGENITSHNELERYLVRLTESTPKVRLVEYGE
jgi:hypothetical protein